MVASEVAPGAVSGIVSGAVSKTGVSATTGATTGGFLEALWTGFLAPEIMFCDTNKL